MIFKSAAAAFAAISIGLAATAAEAKIMVATYTGVVFSGYDEIGTFGSPGQNVVGRSITTQFRYDTTLGIVAYPDPTRELLGGSDFGGSEPILSAWAEIDGRRAYFIGDRASAVQSTSGWDQQAWEYRPMMLHTAMASEAAGGSLLQTGMFPLPYRPRVDENFSLEPAAPTAMGLVYLRKDSPVAGEMPRLTYFVFTPLTLRISAVPEPTTWAMMIVGFGLAGLRLRRRSPACAPLDPARRAGQGASARAG